MRQVSLPSGWLQNFGKPGGYTIGSDRTGLQNTGCESCHGPGSAHVDAAKDAPSEGPWRMKIHKTPRNVCIECHNPHKKQTERVMMLRAARKAKAAPTTAPATRPAQ